jgi:transposase InsO family protein
MRPTCRALQVARSNMIEQIKRGPMSRKIMKQSDQEIMPDILNITQKKPTYGYRRVTALLRKLRNESINHKRVYRVMRQQGLLLQKATGRPTRTNGGKVETIHSNVRWCSDAFGIRCWNGDQLQVAFSMDCHDREVLTWVTSTKGIDGELVRDLMAESVENRFGYVPKLPYKIQWLSDNGPGYTAHETVNYGRRLGFEICTTAPYSPESNGMAEAFVKTFKRDYVCVNDLPDAETVRCLLPRWFETTTSQLPTRLLK